MKIVALICRHDLTIFAESNPRKSRGASSYKIAVTRTRSNKMQGPSSRSLRAPSLSALRFLDKLRRAPARLDQRCSCASRCNSKNQCADKRFSMANSSSSSRTQVRFILPSLPRPRNRPNPARLSHILFSFHFKFSGSPAALENLRWHRAVPGQRPTTRFGRSMLRPGIGARSKRSTTAGSTISRRQV